MLKTLYIVRHCQAVRQEPNAPLTSEGNFQAIALADLLFGFGIERVISSHLLEHISQLLPLLNVWVSQSDFSRDLENLSLNLSPTRRETLNFPPSRVGKGARGLGQSLAFPHDVKSQVSQSRLSSFKGCSQ